ncbi:family 43 glycosylhydrolase [Flavicella sediminum]|uniref:family 43 glycosylhydrolase n=1 Tax=Flavicella sediminum TaxID=2585141 RepID=UPI00111CC04D|nr:family 43 glycosylhydrolase [Flavicella sediminum]
MKRYKTLLVFALLAGSLANAQNPIVTHMYTADPTARVFDGKLYVYPSTDIRCEEGFADNGFCMPYYHVFSTENMTTWKDHGLIIDQTDVPWGNPKGFGMWAPDCVKKGDTYYYYFPAPPADKSSFRRIGVATSKSPTGPFSVEKNYIKGIEGIDPNVLVDDDGKAYMYYGGGENLFVVELAQDMKSIKGKPQKIETLPGKYKEGSFVFKKDGTYYFTFPHAPGGSEEIAYATGTNPKGPFTYQGVILDRWKDGAWTNHHSIVAFKKQWYIFYHHHDISNDQHLRSMRVDSLFFNKKGLIQHKTATLRGVGLHPIDQPIQIDRYTTSKNLKISRIKESNEVNWQLDYIKSGSEVSYNAVDFSSKKVKNVTYKVSSGTQGGLIKLYINNQLITTTQVHNTGGWNNWQEVSSPISKKIKGVQNIKLVFEGGTNYLLNIDWVKFN